MPLLRATPLMKLAAHSWDQWKVSRTQTCGKDHMFAASASRLIAAPVWTGKTVRDKKKSGKRLCRTLHCLTKLMNTEFTCLELEAALNIRMYDHYHNITASQTKWNRALLSFQSKMCVLPRETLVTVCYARRHLAWFRATALNSAVRNN